MLENWKGPHIIQGIKPFSPEKKNKAPQARFRNAPSSAYETEFQAWPDPCVWVLTQGRTTPAAYDFWVLLRSAGRNSWKLHSNLKQNTIPKSRHMKQLPRRNWWAHPCWISVTNRKVTPKQVIFNEHDQCVNKNLIDQQDFGAAGRWIQEEIIKHEERPFKWAFTECNVSRMCNAAGNYAFFSLQFLCKVKKTRT